MNMYDRDRRREEEAVGVENTVGQIKVPANAHWGTPGEWVDFARATEAECRIWLRGEQLRGRPARLVDWITHEPIDEED